jgi:hypothetical protein
MDTSIGKQKDKDLLADEFEADKDENGRSSGRASEARDLIARTLGRGFESRLRY